VFMTVLVHELMHRTGQELNAAITGADDFTRQRYVRDYENPMYRESKLLRPTAAPETPNRAPLVFRFTTGDPREQNGRLGRAGRRRRGEPRRTLLSFFDTAGEDLRSQQSWNTTSGTSERPTASCCCWIHCRWTGRRSWPPRAPGCRPREPPTTSRPTCWRTSPSFCCPRTGRGPGGQISKPLAIVFTKMDALLHDLRETSPLRRPAPTTPYFDEQDGRAVHTEMQRLLARWNGSRIDKIAQLNYRRYRYFGVSALGESPTPDNRVPPRGIRPYRVTSPILWILAQFGTIPVK